jgi:hypothetical protein
LSHVDHRARCRRRPRREAFLLLLSFSSALFFFARRSSLVAVVVVVVVVLVVCAGLLRAPEQLRWRSSLITSTRSVRIIIILPPSIVAVAVAARDCFALPKSFYVFKISLSSKNANARWGKTYNREQTDRQKIKRGRAGRGKIQKNPLI